MHPHSCHVTLKPPFAVKHLLLSLSPNLSCPSLHSVGQLPSKIHAWPPNSFFSGNLTTVESVLAYCSLAGGQTLPILGVAPKGSGKPTLRTAGISPTSGKQIPLSFWPYLKWALAEPSE